jgi:hypothetical protein
MSTRITALAASSVALGLTIGTVLSPGVAFANAGNAIAPLADAYVSSAHPHHNYGSSVRVWVDDDADTLTGYFKFDVTKSIYDEHNACDGGVFSASSATLTLKVDNASDGVQEIWVTSPDWTEDDLTHANRPARVGSNPWGYIYGEPGELIDGFASIAIDGQAIDQACRDYKGILSLVVRNLSDNAIAFKTKEAYKEQPQLFVVVGD